ncbi:MULTISPECIES: tRNA1(Val) (adenine(37)-N6)-methyltransferase [Psychrilyobacter]|uniref:Methyltransferase domain-containing protein n=1 Tax=Psychrilyobacter piezotolerans TaxID=2293438 RepID=A0ABX9KKD8_9FUSO|nr:MULTISPECIES: methyltransferase [Psychrilyobacter]MCS5420841.1 tRNA (adenine(22)-N(1))-methyltransferase TrmK [Psychrilyobacter sp. S5]NDI76839.1 methyltransferase [Psychrilyobacter piezotolerans]RDE65118.1 methyltransferase domain-containing protein [Psychrilyobacter sp. S5]REI42688.1 methyltransferase domain-containing protein [Psychrilyobacter piezotolerans]
MRADENLEPLDHGMVILQKKDGFRFGEDAVMVAEFFTPAKSGKLLDIGTGTGIISLILSRNPKIDKITSVEIQEEMAGMAKRSVEKNDLTEKIEVLNIDIKNLNRGNTYDYIVSNPPYMKSSNGKVNPRSMKAISRHEITLNLKELITESRRLLKPGGSLTLIYRSERMVELLNNLSELGFYPKRIQNIFSENTKVSKLFMIEAVKGKNKGFEFLEPLYIK